MTEASLWQQRDKDVDLQNCFHDRKQGLARSSQNVLAPPSDMVARAFALVQTSDHKQEVRSLIQADDTLSKTLHKAEEAEDTLEDE